MKYLTFIASCILSVAGLGAGIQNGITVPDQLNILNDTNHQVTIGNHIYKPGQTAEIQVNNSYNPDSGELEIQIDKIIYTLSYLVYKPGIPIQELFVPQDYKISNFVRHFSYTY